MAYVKHEWECGDILTPELMNHIEDGIEEASQSGGGGGVVTSQLHEAFATIASIPANGDSYVDVPINTLGITDPDTIVMVSVEYNIAEYRMNYPASSSIVVGYSIRRDAGANSYIRLLAKNNTSSAYSSVRIRFVYTTL